MHKMYAHACVFIVSYFIAFAIFQVDKHKFFTTLNQYYQINDLYIQSFILCVYLFKIKNIQNLHGSQRIKNKKTFCCSLQESLYLTL